MLLKSQVTHSMEHKNKYVKLINIKNALHIFIITLITVGALFVALIWNAERIGDWYAKRENRNYTIAWYEINYTFRRSEDSLRKLCDSLLLSEDFSRIYKYYGILFEEYQTEIDDSSAVSLANLVLSSYYVKGFDTYRLLYIKYVYDLTDYTAVFFPLDAIDFDPQATQDALKWEIEFTETLLQLNSKPRVRLGIYISQVIAYRKLGDQDKAEEIYAISESIRKEIIDGK